MCRLSLMFCGEYFRERREWFKHLKKQTGMSENVEQWRSSILNLLHYYCSCRADSSICLFLPVRVSSSQASWLSRTLWHSNFLTPHKVAVGAVISPHVLVVKCHSHKDGSWSDLAEVCVCVMRLKRILAAWEWKAALQQFSVTSQEGWVTGSSVRLQSSHMKTLWEE